ncbi:hypothetical protein [Janibacter anophelis]|uniref:hypothetical protein n=1 Tax=Janibacter anophelis TaxID=319054 RepID=UPI000DEFC1FB|nr:hypothetical protein [Janibacter anophelis]
MKKSQYQRPEGRLIEEELKATGRSVRSIAPKVGVSDTRLRHIINGYQPAGAGQVIEVKAPAETLARLAIAVGLADIQMTWAGRDDAAQLMAAMDSGGDVTDPAPDTTAPATRGELLDLRKELLARIERLEREEGEHGGNTAPTKPAPTSGATPTSNVKKLPSAHALDPTLPEDIAARDEKQTSKTQRARERQDRDSERPD